MKSFNKRTCSMLLLFLYCGVQAQVSMRIKDTVHNLSVSGPGRIKATAESQICIFCHTPHGAAPDVRPLWNREEPVSFYKIYQSTSLQAQPGQPTGSSKLCLSCHDGTIALGKVLSRPVPIQMATYEVIPAGSTNLGTDLSDDHPISFSYASAASSDPELFPPGSIHPPVVLDKNGEVQCTSCHEPHSNVYGKFLRGPNTRSALCLCCHRKTGWDTSIHSVSQKLIPPEVASVIGSDSVPVSENACRNCHVPHHARSTPWLLIKENGAATCLVCHNGSVAQDIASSLSKVSNHGINPEGPIGTTGTPFIEGDRVSCADCHNPHMAGSPGQSGVGLPTSLAGVAGVTLQGSPTAAIRYEYELCFRCHGDSPVSVSPLVVRDIFQPNKRLQFQPTNPSFHPVAAPGANPNVPSLRPPLQTSSTITCGDCHGSDESPAGGGSGPAGPHGSNYKPLLVAPYETSDYTRESADAYALCYRCHLRDSILRNESFKHHKKHIVGAKAPCSVCHDPHGIYSGQVTASSGTHLINFDRSVVSPSKSGILKFVDLGTYRGACYLNCHGHEHNPKEYHR